MNERRRFLQVLGGSVIVLGCGSSGGTGAESTGGTGGTSAGGVAGAGTGGAGAGGSGGGCSPGASNSGTNNDKCGSNAGKFDVGTPDDYPTAGVYKTSGQSSNALIARDAAGLYAMSSLCTHQCCDLNGSSGTLTTYGIRCNCHGSRFAPDGSVIQGPAYQALAHYALTLECDGHLYVDTTQIVDTATRLQGA